MRGRYIKAPLSYVRARLVIKELTTLLPEQSVLLAQKMKMIGFNYKELSEGKKIKFNIGVESVTDVLSGTLFRTCFLTSNRSTAILFDEQGIEYRTTSYTRFDDVCGLFQKVMDTISEIPVYNSLKIEEAILSYVDVIIGNEDYPLPNFFKHGKNILPMNFFDQKDCLLSYGKTEINKVLKDNHRVEISIEELPQKANRYVSSELAELEPKFAMPIDMPYKLNSKSADSYVLVTTSGYELHGDEIIREEDGLHGKSVREFLEQSHITCRNEFNSLINKEVCDIVWEYKKD